MLSLTMGCAVLGVHGQMIEVEVDVANGLPAFSTVGLPDSTVRESKDRVKAAISNCGYQFPAKRITVNLAPAELKKEGAGFDLPIALGILLATATLQVNIEKKWCAIGELSLDGTIRRVKGILSMIMAAKDRDFDVVILPDENRSEAIMVPADIELIAVRSLPEVVEFLAGNTTIADLKRKPPEAVGTPRGCHDFADIMGMTHAKRALEIAAAGGHNVLMKGPPGAGKTMLARSMPSILPSMTIDEILDTAKIHSVSGKIEQNGEVFTMSRPFRAPHHTISDSGLIGGGAIPQPGEVSLAHNGVLFLDELPEFKRHVLEVLRQPMEDGTVTIARANMTLTFPARFCLIAAMNPCPCGYYGESTNRCRCVEPDIKRYTGKISGPLLDRIDIQIEVPATDFTTLTTPQQGESSSTVQKRVDRTRSLQTSRFQAERDTYCNSQMTSTMVRKYCPVEKNSERLLEKSAHQFGMSARGYHRVLKLSRTIADLEQSAKIHLSHVAEAVQLCRFTV